MKTPGDTGKFSELLLLFFFDPPLYVFVCVFTRQLKLTASADE